jgi:hypothetical protein
MMVPTDHISTGQEYCFAPSRISGARYHKVTTYTHGQSLVNVCSLMAMRHRTGLHLMRVRAERHSEGTCETEIGKLESPTLRVNQHVLWLKIPAQAMALVLMSSVQSTKRNGIGPRTDERCGASGTSSGRSASGT